MLDLRKLNKYDMQEVLDERHKVPETLRTAKTLTIEEQMAWYDTQIANRESHTRYFGFYDGPIFIGYGGLENIQWENRSAEISVLIFERFRKKGYGEKAVWAILRTAFDTYNLDNVWGECYECGNVEFWEKVNHNIRGNNEGWKNIIIQETTLPRRKYFNGEYFNSYYWNYGRI
jgi:hypothetical protein